MKKVSVKNKDTVNNKCRKPKSLIAIIAAGLLFISLIFSANYSFSFLNFGTVDFIKTCLSPWDIGNVATKYAVVRTIGDTCHKRCKSECEGLAQKINNQNLSDVNLIIEELNPDIISKCKQACKEGADFGSPMRIPDKTSTKGLDFEWSDVIYADTAKFTSQDRSPSISSKCAVTSTASDSAANNIYLSGYKIKSGQKFKAMLVGNPAEDSFNEIAMCGDEVVRIDPSYIGFTNNDWNNNSALWNPRTNSKNGFNARNYLFTNTELDIVDGDQLSITYWGQYQFGPKAACPPNGCFSQFLKLGTPGTFSGIPLNAANSGFLLPSSQFKFSNPVLGINGFPTDASIQQGYSDAASNRALETLGLRASTGKIMNSTFKADIPKEQQYFDTGGYTIDKQNFYISFYGTLTGYSNTFSRLGIAHADSTDVNSWNDNVGGFSVLLRRKGCTFKQGERLQWGLLRKQNTVSESEAVYETVPSEWYDIDVNDIKNANEITATYSCQGLGAGVDCEAQLVYRIKPMSFDTSKVDVCLWNDQVCQSTRERVQKLYSPANTSGQYNVLTVLSEEASSNGNVFTIIVRKIRNHLFFGEASNNPNVETGRGIVQIIFENLVSSDFANAIRALAVLYIAYTGLSFMIGTVQITQKEAATRLLKLSVVLTLTAPNAWSFFYNNFFALFVDGGLQLMVLVAGGLDPTQSSTEMAAMSRDPTLFFTFFDYPVKILFAQTTMIKVGAVALSSFMGLLVALIIIFAGAIYALCLFKAVVIYLISLIGIGVLLILSPIFISFMLFKYTSEMFKGWWTQLAILVAQPIFVIVGITIFNILLIMGLRVVLGFTACFGCFLGINLPFIQPICIIPGVFPLYNLHLPDDIGPAGVQSAQVCAALFFLLLAQGVYYFVNFATSIANLIVGSAFAGMNLSQAYQAFDPKEKVYNAMKFATGTDHEAVGAYQQYVGYKRSIRDTGQKIKAAATNAKDGLKRKSGDFKKGLDNLTKKVQDNTRNTGIDNGDNSGDNNR